MGKILIIKGADFSKNALSIAKAVSNTPATQFVYAADTPTPSSSFDWDAHKIEIQVRDDGTITSFNLPKDVTALPRFTVGGNESSDWLSEIDLSYLSAFPLTCLRSMLVRCSALKRITLGGTFMNLSGTSAMEYMVSHSDSIEKVTIREDFNAPNLQDIKYMFCESGIKAVDGLKYLIKSSITNMSTMFFNCSRLKEVDFTDCDTSNVTTFIRLFQNCSNLSNIIGINELDVANVTDFTNAFMECSSLQQLSIKDWTIGSNVITTSMFSGAGMTHLDVSCFTSLYGNVNDMFKLRNWNTIHLDNLNDVSAVTSSDNFFSNTVSGTPKVTIANVTNEAVKTFLKSKLDAVSAGGSSDWQETTVDGVLCLVPNV